MGKNSHNSTSVKNNSYGTTTTQNPYVTATTNNSGTTTTLNPNTAFNSVYNFVNNNIESLLNEYLNPNLNSITNQAKLNAFTKNLSSESYKNLENNIINPLSEKKMLRSSQASDLYQNLSDANTSSLSNYIDNLLAEAQLNTGEILDKLLSSYMLGYDVISDTQRQSLKTSAGNSTQVIQENSKSKLSAADAENIINLLGKIFSIYSSTTM